MSSVLTSMSGYSNNAHLSVFWPPPTFTRFYSYCHPPSLKVSPILRISTHYYAQKQVCSHPSAPNVRYQQATWGRCLDPTTAVLSEDTALWGHSLMWHAGTTLARSQVAKLHRGRTMASSPSQHTDLQANAAGWPRLQHPSQVTLSLLLLTSTAVGVRPTDTEGNAVSTPMPMHKCLGSQSRAGLCADTGVMGKQNWGKGWAWGEVGRSWGNPVIFRLE